MSHTPGPWGWVSVPAATSVGIHGPTGPLEAIATVHASDSGLGSVTLANARLIAAAPDMCTALKRLVELSKDDGAESTYAWRDAFVVAEAVIGKAEGWSPAVPVTDGEDFSDSVPGMCAARSDPGNPDLDDTTVHGCDWPIGHMNRHSCHCGVRWES